MIRVELMEKWLADRGKKLTSEDKRHSRVFLPYLIMDTAYQVYCKHIMTVPASFRLLQLRKLSDPRSLISTRTSSVASQ